MHAIGKAYMDKKIFITNLQRAYANVGVSTERGFNLELSQRFGVSRQAVTDWLSVNGPYPRLTILEKMSEETGMSLDELLMGKKPLSIIEAKPKQIPIFSLSELENCNFDNIDLLQNMHSPKKIYSPLEINDEKLLGVLQLGDSMVNTSGPSFSDGSIIVFDIDKKKPASGDLVLARLPDGTIIFRKYTKEEREYLVPLNLTAYKSYNDKFDIIGVFLFSLFI